MCPLLYFFWLFQIEMCSSLAYKMDDCEAGGRAGIRQSGDQAEGGRDSELSFFFECCIYIPHLLHIHHFNCLFSY